NGHILTIFLALPSRDYHRFQRVVGDHRYDDAISHLADTVAGSSDPLDEPRNLVRTHVLDDIVDSSGVNSQFEARSCDKAFDLAFLQRSLGSDSRELRQAGVVYGDWKVDVPDFESAGQDLGVC